MIKVTISFGDEMKGAKITYPEGGVPVTLNYCHNAPPIGRAILHEEADQLWADIDIDKGNLPAHFACGVAGIVTGKEDNLITGFAIKSVSIISQSNKV